MTTLAVLLALAQTSSEAKLVVVDGFECHPRNVLIKVENEAILDRIEQSGLHVSKYIPQISWAVVEAPLGRLQETRKLLSSTRGIANAEYDHTSEFCYVPNDPLWPSQWNMKATKVDKAWDFTIGTAGAIVATIDDGVNINHPDLAPNIWVNPGEIPGNGIDDEGNGLVDDVNGWNFANDSNDIGGGIHGTAGASLIAGRGDNGIGLSGVAPRARIMVIKSVANTAKPLDSVLMEAYVYAADMGAHIFSLAYMTFAESQAQKDALFYAYNKGVLPVASAGNYGADGGFRYPAMWDFVLAVTATDETGVKASFANFGPWVDVAAPGVNLTVADPNGGYRSDFWGTSGSTPQVAGLAALLKGANKKANRVRLRSLIENTSDLVADSPLGAFSGVGIMNAEAAMSHLVAGTTPPPHSPTVSYAAPIGYASTGKQTFIGKNLTGAKVKVGGALAVITTANATSITFKAKPGPGPITVEDSSGNLVGSYDPALASGLTWPAGVATHGNPLSMVKGGYAEMIRPDGKVVTATWGNGIKAIALRLNFYGLPTSGPVKLVLKRTYPNARFGTEKINIEGGPLLLQTPIPLASQDVTIPIADIAPYVTADGRMQIVITGDVAKTVIMQLDAAYFTK